QKHADAHGIPNFGPKPPIEKKEHMEEPLPSVEHLNKLADDHEDYPAQHEVTAHETQETKGTYDKEAHHHMNMADYHGSASNNYKSAAVSLGKGNISVAKQYHK